MINLLKDNICKDVIVDNVFDPNKYNESLLSSENLEGIISYFPGEQGYFPDVIYNQPINILMSYEQESKYKIVYQKEKILTTRILYPTMILCIVVDLYTI